MSPWKVIVATLVIFVTGVITGAFVAQRSHSKMPLPSAGPRQAQEVMPTPWFVRREFLERMDRQLNLSREQYDRIARIIQDGQERTHIIVGLVSPEIQEELREVRREIRAELTPEQRKRFEEMQQFMRSGGGPGQRRPQFDNRPPGPNRDFRPGPPPDQRPNGPQ